ncbi:hypothetical protein [uncultured Eudoraea sp.]|uniref:hypothetical protein n=1 Tax=uncultured Eudoraea sp. TaxID=1035614 RepID=UPI002610A17E|nr:hypothetical protein [uncultured Eudoraea sp.]
MKKALIVVALLVMGCSSTELVDSWKNPDIVIFDASKVLVVGMTSNLKGQEDFETKMKRQFTKRGVEAMRSIDLFDVGFTDSERSEEELDDVEQSLLDKDFDAILFTKILGAEDKQTFRKNMADLDSYYGTFKEDYISHQDIYYDENYYDEYKVYRAETSLYCICVGKERQLIWRGIIDITDPSNIKNTVDDYVKLVVFALEEQDLIFHKEEDNEATSSL